MTCELRPTNEFWLEMCSLYDMDVSMSDNFTNLSDDEEISQFSKPNTLAELLKNTKNKRSRTEKLSKAQFEKLAATSTMNFGIPFQEAQNMLSIADQKKRSRNAKLVAGELNSNEGECYTTNFTSVREVKSVSEPVKKKLGITEKEEVFLVRPLYGREVGF